MKGLRLITRTGCSAIAFPLLLVVVATLASCASRSHTRLVDGGTAPDLTLVDSDGRSHRLIDLDKVYLNFFRYAGCPICNFRMHELNAEARQFALEGITVIAVFESSDSVLAEYRGELSNDIVLVGDPALELYRAFGVERSLGKLMRGGSKKDVRRRAKEGKTRFGESSDRRGQSPPKRDGSLTRVPAEFILERGRIRKAHYGEYVGDHMPLYYVHQY